MSNTSPDRRVALSNQIMELLDSWGTDGRQKIVLLGLPEDMRSRYAFPQTGTLSTG